MNPLPLILHLAAVAVGVWAGLALIGAIGTPEGTGAEARAEQEAAAEAEERAKQRERDEECEAAADSADGLPSRVRREMLRSCAEGPGLPPRSLCFSAVAAVVDVGPARGRAIDACRAIEER